MSTLQDIEKTPQISYQSDEDEEKSPSVSTITKKNRRSWEKLGLKNVAILTIGTLAVLAGAGLLIALWSLARYARSTGTVPLRFEYVIQHATRMVTLCCVFIRLATGAQLGVFAAILAALILERVGVSRTDLPQLSMIRCSNNGPMSLIWNVWHSLRVTSQILYSLLVIVGILNGFGLQLMSSILIGDFYNIHIGTRSAPGTGFFNIPVGLPASGSSTNLLLDNGADFWKSGSTNFTPFAEQNWPGLEGSDFVDTGRTYRGFIPRSSVRTLRYYEGPSTVVDMRVICTAPSIQNFTFDDVKEQGLPELHGTLEWTGSPPAVRKNPGVELWDIKCDMPIHTPAILNDTVSSYWALSLCTLKTGCGELTEGLRTDFDPTLANQTSTFLLINVTGSWSNYASAFSNESVTLTRSQNSTGPWATYEQNDKRVDTSLCFFNPTPHDYYVNVIQNPDMKGYNMDMDDTQLTWNTTTASYDAEDVLLYLGVHPDEWVVGFQLSKGSPDKSWENLQIEKHDNVTTNDFVWDVVQTPRAENTDSWTLSPYTNITAVYRSHYEITQAILKQTGDPALAVQGLLTMVMHSAYRDYLNQFSVTAPADIIDSEPVYIPWLWKSLRAVLALLGFHLLLMATAVVLFMKQTEISLLGSNWHAILQVVSLDKGVRDVPNGETMTDKEMLSLVGDDTRLRIGRPAAT